MRIAAAVSIAKRGRKLLRQGRITAKQYVLLDCLLWSCRAGEGEVARVSYTALERLCHAARSTIATALDTLQGLGLLSRIRSRQRFGWASRQAVNRYLLHARTEFDQPTGTKNEKNPEAMNGAAAQAALRNIAGARGDTLAAAWLTRRRGGG